MYASLLSPQAAARPLARAGRWVAGVMLTLALVACGFHIKGTAPLPFDTLYTNVSDNTAFGSHLRRVIRAASPNLRFVDSPAKAQAILTQLSMDESTREIAIGPDGLVEEYELRVVYSFQLTDPRGHVLLPPTTLEVRREVPYDASVQAAKQVEINTVFLDMRRSLADRIVRRLTSPQVVDAYRATLSGSSRPVDATDDGLQPLPATSGPTADTPETSPALPALPPYR